MALINCNECGREISDKATSCIHCGYPLNNKTLSNPTSKKKLYVIVAIIILALIIFITLNSKNIYGTYKQLDLTDGKEGTLTLYENGTCHWQFYRISTEGTFFEHDKEFSAYRCKYSYTNDKNKYLETLAYGNGDSDI